MIFMFELEATKKVIEQAREAKCDVVLMKEEGLWIQAERRQSEGNELHKCHAVGFSPSNDAYHSLCIVFGNGSDRCFYFAVDNVVFDSVIEKGYILGIEVTLSEHGEPKYLLIGYSQK